MDKADLEQAAEVEARVAEVANLATAHQGFLEEQEVMALLDVAGKMDVTEQLAMDRRQDIEAT